MPSYTYELLSVIHNRWMAAQSVFYHLYNQVSYMSLDEISPLTFSIGNTMKRISVIVSSIIIFHTPVQPVNALGAAIAIFGTFLYSQVSPCYALSLIVHTLFTAFSALLPLLAFWIFMINFWLPLFPKLLTTRIQTNCCLYILTFSFACGLLSPNTWDST